MRVQLRREGGIVFLPSLHKIWSLDSQTMPPNDGIEFERLIKEANVFCLPATMPSGTAGAADQYHYTLMVEQEGHAHSVHFTELTENLFLQKLRQYIQTHGTNVV